MSATIVEAVVKLATKVKGETVKPANATIAAALDTLADALAGENVQAKPTIASAIDMITENYTPGGGGGVDVGALVQVMYLENSETEPAVGDAVDLTTVYNVAVIKIGDATIADTTTSGSSFNSSAGWASGVTLTTYWMPAYDDPTHDAAYAFLYTVETVEEVDYYKTVTILQDAVTMETKTDELGDVQKRYTYTVPEVGEGTFFAVSYVGNWD